MKIKVVILISLFSLFYVDTRAQEVDFGGDNEKEYREINYQNLSKSKKMLLEKNSNVLLNSMKDLQSSYDLSDVWWEKTEELKTLIRTSAKVGDYNELSVDNLRYSNENIRFMLEDKVVYAKGNKILYFDFKTPSTKEIKKRPSISVLSCGKDSILSARITNHLHDEERGAGTDKKKLYSIDVEKSVYKKDKSKVVDSHICNLIYDKMIRTSNVSSKNSLYKKIKHGEHYHYVPENRDPDVPVSRFPTSPPGPDERITADGRVVKMNDES